MTLLCTYDFPPQHGGVARYHRAVVDALSPECDVMVADRHIHWLRLLPMLRRRARQGVHHVLTSEALPIGTVALLHRYWTGIPYVIACHGLDLGIAQQHTRKRLLLRFVLRGAALVLANSAFTATRAVQAGANPECIRIVHPPVGITPNALRGRAMRDEHHLQGRFLVCSVGRLVPRKGFDVLIRAIALLQRDFALPSPPTLVIVGDGPERAALEICAQREGVEVRWIPDATDDVVAAWYAACDVFALLPRALANGDAEGFGIVYLEAGAFGKPVIGTRSGGVPDAIADGVSGIMVAPDDPHAAAHALRILATDPVYAAALGEAGRTRVEKCSTFGHFRTHIREIIS
ncbi:glycosyltransferase family 4 protein [Candidatus Uhrbacteria bacterium]|nr:glycosyltransferase family 4 protein [Candidatus Uhrbacteria bacterium]